MLSWWRQTERAEHWSRGLINCIYGVFFFWLAVASDNSGPFAASSKKRLFFLARLLWGLLDSGPSSSTQPSTSQGHVCVCVCVKSLQSRPTVTKGCGLPGSSIHENSPGKSTGVDCMPSSRGSSWPRNQTCVSYVSAGAGRFFTTSTTWEAPSRTCHLLNTWQI